MQGEKIGSVKNEIGNFGIDKAVKLGDEYLVKLWHYETGEQLIKVQSDGAITESFTYSAEDTRYYTSLFWITFLIMKNMKFPTKS